MTVNIIETKEGQRLVMELFTKKLKTGRYKVRSSKSDSSDNIYVIIKLKPNTPWYTRLFKKEVVLGASFLLPFETEFSKSRIRYNNSTKIYLYCLYDTYFEMSTRKMDIVDIDVDDDIKTLYNEFSYELTVAINKERLKYIERNDIIILNDDTAIKMIQEYIGE